MRKPTAPLALSLVALFLALGGTGLAAKHYLITSTGQIKPSVLKKLKGKTGPAGPAGPQGARGDIGIPGPTGPPGPTNLSGLFTVVGPTAFVPAGKVGSAEAVCPPATRAVSGGGSGSIAGIGVSEMETAHTSWFIIITNESSITLSIHAEVQCAGAGQAVAARAPRITHMRLRQRKAELEAAQAAAAHR